MELGPIWTTDSLLTFQPQRGLTANSGFSLYLAWFLSSPLISFLTKAYPPLGTVSLALGIQPRGLNTVPEEAIGCRAAVGDVVEEDFQFLVVVEVGNNDSSDRGGHRELGGSNVLEERVLRVRR